MAEQMQLVHMIQPEPKVAQLIQQIAEGDVQAFHTLHAQYGARMMAFAYRLVGDAVVAEDIVQESLIAVWQSAHRYRGQGRVLSWLLGIVHNKAQRTYRRRKHESLEEEQEYPSAIPLPENLLEESQEKQLLWQRITRLSTEHQTVLDLVFFHNLSLKETASVLHCPLGTVKSRLNYAKKALRGMYLREQEQEFE